MIQLKIRMRELHAGELFHLVAHDPGARQDIPAWCLLTGNELVSADHPAYVIRRRGSK